MLAPHLDMPSDAQRIWRIKGLVEEGYEDRLVVSHDIHTKHRLVRSRQIEVGPLALLGGGGMLAIKVQYVFLFFGFGGYLICLHRNLLLVNLK